jgi:hypothetical protein
MKPNRGDVTDALQVLAAATADVESVARRIVSPELASAQKRLASVAVYLRRILDALEPRR